MGAESCFSSLVLATGNLSDNSPLSMSPFQMVVGSIYFGCSSSICFHSWSGGRPVKRYLYEPNAYSPPRCFSLGLSHQIQTFVSFEILAKCPAWTLPSSRVVMCTIQSMTQLIGYKPVVRKYSAQATIFQVPLGSLQRAGDNVLAVTLRSSTPPIFSKDDVLRKPEISFQACSQEKLWT